MPLHKTEPKHGKKRMWETKKSAMETVIIRVAGENRTTGENYLQKSIQMPHDLEIMFAFILSTPIDPDYDKNQICLSQFLII